MANFGFSVGDLVMVSKYVYSAYRSIPHAGDEYVSIAEDIKYLYLRLRELDIEDRNPISLLHRATKSQRDEIRAIVNSSHSDLESLTKMIGKHKLNQSLRTAEPRTRDKLRFTDNKQAEIRERIRTHSDRLTRLLSGFQTQALGRLEDNSERQIEMFEEIIDKLNSLMKDIKTGQKDVSVLKDVENWCSHDKELTDEDFMNASFEAEDNHYCNRSRFDDKMSYNAYDYEYIGVEQDEDDEGEAQDGGSKVVPGLYEEVDQDQEFESHSKTKRREKDSEEENTGQKQEDSRVLNGTGVSFRPTRFQDLRATVEDYESADEFEGDTNTYAPCQSERTAENECEPEPPLSSNHPDFPKMPIYQQSPKMPPPSPRPAQFPKRHVPPNTNPAQIRIDTRSGIFMDSGEEYDSEASFSDVSKPRMVDSNRWGDIQIPRQRASCTRSISPTIRESYAHGRRACSPASYGDVMRPEIMKIKATASYYRIFSGERQDRIIHPNYTCSYESSDTKPYSFSDFQEVGSTIFWNIELDLGNALYGWDEYRTFPDGAVRSLCSRCPTLGNWTAKIEGEGGLISRQGKERGDLYILVTVPEGLIVARQLQVDREADLSGLSPSSISDLGDPWCDTIEADPSGLNLDSISDFDTPWVDAREQVTRPRRLKDWPTCAKSSMLKGRYHDEPGTGLETQIQSPVTEEEHKCNWECTWKKSNPIFPSNDFVLCRAGQRLTGRIHQPSEFLERNEYFT